MVAQPESAAGRRSLAKQGKALSDGSFPIPDVSYLKKAIRAKGRTPSSKWPALARLIRRRAHELHATNAPGVKGTWAFSNEMVFAGSLPVASASDGPRIVKTAGARLGLQPHEVKAYAKFRKRGASHRAAMTFARRVRSRANIMGSAATVGSGTGSKAYSRDETVTDLAAFRMDTPASNAKGGQLTSAARATKGRTDQTSKFTPQASPRSVRSGGTEGNPRKPAIVRSAVPRLRASSATPPGGKLLKQSAGKYTWPDNKGQGSVPATPVSTGQGFKTPSNLVVKAGVGSQAKQAVGTRKQQIAYGKLRGMGVSHATAMKVVSQYYGSGKPKNSLGTRKGGSLTNLRMKQTTGTGASSPSPKAV